MPWYIFCPRKLFKAAFRNQVNICWYSDAERSLRVTIEGIEIHNLDFLPKRQIRSRQACLARVNRFDLLFQRRRLALTNSNIVKWLVSFSAHESRVFYKMFWIKFNGFLENVEEVYGKEAAFCLRFSFSAGNAVCFGIRNWTTLFHIWRSHPSLHYTALYDRVERKKL